MGAHWALAEPGLTRKTRAVRAYRPGLCPKHGLVHGTMRPAGFGPGCRWPNLTPSAAWPRKLGRWLRRLFYRGRHNDPWAHAWQASPDYAAPWPPAPRPALLAPSMLPDGLYWPQQEARHKRWAELMAMDRIAWRAEMGLA